MRAFKLLLAGGLLTLLLLPTLSMAQYHAGGRGLFYVHSARSLEKGSLNAYMHSRFFGKAPTAGDFSSVTFWNVQGSVALTYGLNNTIELTLMPIVYQDVNFGGTGQDMPGDVFVRLKVGSLGSASSKMKFGAMLNSRIPLGKNDNVAWESYSAGTLELGLTGMASYAGDVLFPDAAFNFHTNLGFQMHNDSGKLPSADSSSSATSQVTYGLGFSYPFDKWDVSLELNGNAFVQEPPVGAYSRNSYMFLTPGLSYRFASWLKFNFGADLRLSSDSEPNPSIPEGLPNSYPEWRVHSAMQFDILPTSSYRQDERDILVKKAETRREVFEQIVREQKETEKAEQELARIKEERIKAEQELERLRKLLEDDGTKKKKDKP